MTQPKQPDNEPEGLTREFNFPKPWIKDYNPQIHGIKPGMDYQPGGPTPPSAQPGTPQPGAMPGQYPQYPQYPAAPPVPPAQGYNQPMQTTNGQAQWNPQGVYGGEAPKNNGMPTWGWTLISAAILIIVLLVLFFLVLK